MRKYIVIIILLVLIIGAGLLAVNAYTGITSGLPAEITEAKERQITTSELTEPEDLTIKKVEVDKLAKTGIISELYRNNTFVAGTTDEDFLIGSDRTVVFRTVCETGLDNNGGDISARKALYIILREKSSDGLKYSDEVMITLVKDYKEYTEGVLDLSPKVIDAEASDDGSVLRVLCCRNGNTLLYNLNLDKKEWRDKNSISDSPSVICRDWYFEFSPGKVKQAYFLAPDIVFVSTDKGMEYAAKLRFCEGGQLEYGPEKKIVKRSYAANLFYEGVYWNRIGPQELLDVSWRLKKDTLPDGTQVYGTWRLKDDTELPDTPPVPTDRDWEGWHKLERN